MNNKVFKSAFEFLFCIKKLQKNNARHLIKVQFCAAKSIIQWMIDEDTRFSG
jgi:hypothetical protein